MEKMTSTTVNEGIISAIEKIHPSKGDILLFKIKTDENGFPLCDIEVVMQTAEYIAEIINQSGALGLFTMLFLTLALLLCARAKHSSGVRHLPINNLLI